MGDYKKEKCKQGHPLEGTNLVFNSDGARECRKCKYTRAARPKQRERRNFRALLASLELSARYGDILVTENCIARAKENARLFAKASEQAYTRPRKVRLTGKTEEIFNSLTDRTQGLQEYRKRGASV